MIANLSAECVKAGTRCRAHVCASHQKLGATSKLVNAGALCEPVALGDDRYEAILKVVLHLVLRVSSREDGRARTSLIGVVVVPHSIDNVRRVEFGAMHQRLAVEADAHLGLGGGQREAELPVEEVFVDAPVREEALMVEEVVQLVVLEEDLRVQKTLFFLFLSYLQSRDEVIVVSVARRLHIVRRPYSEEEALAHIEGRFVKHPAHIGPHYYAERVVLALPTQLLGTLKLLLISKD